MNLMRDNEVDGELNIMFENSSGQNKNNTVLKQAMWLKEMRYFKQVNFIFLITEHTKNACNHLFNSLKHEYRKKNIFTMDRLTKELKLNVSAKITVVPTVPSNFLSYDGTFKVLYTDLKGLVKKSHLYLRW